MAYVKRGGLETLLRGADSLITKGGSLQIVFGLAKGFGITEWEAAERLLEYSNEHTNVRVKKWSSPGFHPKLLIFHGSPSFLVVGSANLTGGAQTTNAEANLLVQDPSAELMKEAKDFFDRYFTDAPDLERAHVEDYKRHARSNALPLRPKGLREDCLPSPPPPPGELVRLRRSARVWKISPGKRAEFWPAWKRQIGEDGEGVVAMGWNEVRSLDKFETKDALRRKVAETAEKVWNKPDHPRTDEEYVTNQLWDFSREIRKGDLFIVYSKQRVFGIAKVTTAPEYRYRPNPEMRFHQITVRYRLPLPKPERADKQVIAALGKQGTLMLVEDPKFLKDLMSKLP